MSIEELYRRFLECSGACTDTRQLVPGGMFFALKGPSFDANAFASAAIRSGCRYAVVDDASVANDDRSILVPDALKALQDLGRYHRRSFRMPVIGITGTNGKTTTKELAHAVLNAHAPTLATTGNLNNHIGVPLTLLRINSTHRSVIVEMGANHAGEITLLCGIAEPTHGLITNIGKAHLEGFGSYEGVVEAKTELYTSVRGSRGTLFVNADDALLMEKSEGATRITYGTSPDASTRGTLIATGPFLSFRFDGTDGTAHDVSTKLVGNHNLPNALAAVCIGRHFGVQDKVIAQALAAYVPDNNRSQLIDTGRNHVVMDAYNANPSSMRAALENFGATTTDRPRLAILGDMLELGDTSAAEHQAVVDLLRSLKLDAWLIGPAFAAAANNTPFKKFSSAEDALVSAQGMALSGRSILVKGSRGMKLETLLPAL